MLSGGLDAESARQANLRGLLDGICASLAAATGAAAVVIAKRHRARIQIIGAHGSGLKQVGTEFVLPRLSVVTQPILFVENLADDVDFATHPLRKLFPTAKRLFALVTGGKSDANRVVLKIIDPSAKLISLPTTIALIHNLAGVIENIIETKSTSKKVPRAKPISHREEVAGLVEDGPLPAALLNQRQEVVRFNQSLSALMGCQRSELVGKDFRSCFKTPRRPQHAFDFSGTTFDLNLETRGGLPVRCIVLPIPGKRKQMIAVIVVPRAVTHVIARQVESHGRTGLQELHSSNGFQHTDLEPTARFLVKTLVSHPTLLRRNGFRYLAVRTWRQSIKEYQLAALVAIKAVPTDKFVTEVASEIKVAVNETFGSRHLSAVVPIPCGNSGKKRCLSVRMAEAVASDFGIPMIEAFEGQGGSGSSTPKKSSQIKPYVLKHKPIGTVLLLDDVASSGRHLQLATEALREAGCSVHAVVWIGAGGKKK